jgi:ABC-2 type transport system ATP-binding protein
MRVVLDRIEKRFGAQRAVDGLSLTIEAGEIFGLLGPNGAGKTTTVSMLIGLLAPDAGRVELEGLGPPTSPQARRGVGVAPQSLAIYDALTARENLRFFGRLYGLGGAALARRVEELLELVGLSERARSRAGTFSGGMKRRLNLAAGLVHEPRLLLLDEPTVGLDPGARAAFLDLLLERRSDRPLTILMSTHLVDEADRLDRVLLLHQGRLVADGAPADLRRGAGAVVVSVFDPAWTPPAGSGAWRLEGGARRLHLERGGGDARAIAADLAAAGVPFAVAPPTLADVFLQRTGDPLRAGGPDLAAVPRSEAT